MPNLSLVGGLRQEIICTTLPKLKDRARTSGLHFQFRYDAMFPSVELLLPRLRTRPPQPSLRIVGTAQTHENSKSHDIVVRNRGYTKERIQDDREIKELWKHGD